MNQKLINFQSALNHYQDKLDRFQDELTELIEQEKRPPLTVDAPILVSSFDAVYLQRHFKEWTPEGKAACFTDGRTSWTAGDLHTPITIWEFYKLPEEQPLENPNAK